MTKMSLLHAVLLDQNQWMLHQVREENDSLKCQLEAYKNEVDLLKHESTGHTEMRDKQIKALQLALQGMSQVCMLVSNLTHEVDIVGVHCSNHHNTEDLKALMGPSTLALDPLSQWDIAIINVRLSIWTSVH